MSETSENGIARIPMTGRPPVEIEEASWPAVATTRWLHERVDGHEARMWLRKHADGRHLVHGWSTGSLGSRCAGLLVPTGQDPIPAIKEVAQLIGESFGIAERALVDETLAQLPAERI